MSKERTEALNRLRQNLTRDQIDDIALIIDSAEIEEYFLYGHGYDDDGKATLHKLASEFQGLR